MNEHDFDSAQQDYVASYERAQAFLAVSRSILDQIDATPWWRMLKTRRLIERCNIVHLFVDQAVADMRLHLQRMESAPMRRKT